ncbi:MAG: ABC transporter substrate-binding protein [Candidatus Tectomicrobia bacterium]|nr:ABC transporter substrate-binding protein [Candidatus Tectomicrobia bacterium]
MAQRAEVTSEVGTTPAAVKALWYTRCPIPTVSSLAIDHGWLDEEFAPDGIEIASLRASEEQRIRESHFDHTQSDSFRQGGNIPPIWTRSRGGDVRLIGLSWVDEYQAIIARPESGIRTIRDLRGRRLALPRRVNDQIDFWRAMCLRGYLSALALEGMDERDAELVDLPMVERYLGADSASHRGTLWSGGHRARRQQVEAFALIHGNVDAMYSAGAAGAWLADFLGATTVVDVGRHPDHTVRTNNQTPTALTASGELVRNHPDLVARYVKRLNDAARWAATHRSEVALIVAKDVGAPAEWVDAAHASDFHCRMEVNLAEESIAAIERQKDFLLRWGFIKADFDLQAWIAWEPLRGAGLA